MRYGDKAQVGERIGRVIGIKKNTVHIDFGTEKIWVNKSQAIPAKTRYTVGDISEILEVTKPNIYYHLKRLGIKTKELPVREESMHKQTIINGSDAIKLLAALHAPTDKVIELRKVAKALHLHYVSVDYHLRKLKIKKFRRRLRNGHSAIVINQEDAQRLKERIR